MKKETKPTVQDIFPDIKPAHTQGEWKIISEHPVLKNLAIVVDAGRNTEKNIENHKVICELPDWRGDSFVRLEEGEAEANAQRIVRAVNMHDSLVIGLRITFDFAKELYESDGKKKLELDKIEQLLKQAEQK